MTTRPAPSRAPGLTAYQRKLLAGFLSVSTVLFFLFSVLLLGTADRRYRAELSKMGRETIQQARSTCDSLLVEVFRYGLEAVTLDPSVSRLMYKSTFDTGDAIACKELFTDIQRYNSYVDNIYLINYENRCVMTKNGRVALDAFYDTDLLEQVEQTPVSSIPVRYLPRVATVASPSNQRSEEQVWTVIFRQSPNGAFVMNVDVEQFALLMNVQTDVQYLHNYVLNGKNQVLLSSEAERFGQDMSEDPLLAAVRAQPSKEGSFVYDSPTDHKRFTVHYIQNGYLGMTYLSAVEDVSFGAGNTLFTTILLWSVLFLLLTMLGSFAVTRFVYRPVKGLIQALRVSASRGSDEFSLFRDAYDEMRRQNDRLASNATAYRRAAEARLLRKLVDPQSVTEKIPADQVEAIQNYFADRCCCCVIFNIDSLCEMMQKVEDLGLLKYSITNMMEELAEGEFHIKSLDYALNQSVYLCGLDSTDASPLRHALETVQSVLHQHFHVQATVAVGVAVHELEDLPQSLQSAKYAVARRFADGNGRLVFCQEQIPQESMSCYPEEEETRLLNAVRSGDAEQTDAALGAFFAAIQPCRVESILSFLMQLDLACQRLETANHLDTAPVDVGSFLLTSGTLEDLHAQFRTRLLAVVESINQRRDSNAEKLIQRVNELVNANLCDPNLSVVWLADEVHLSVNYLRNIYKESTGESLSSYITAAKLQLICELLQNTDLTIQEISERLGFTTRNYFFTFFKKNMGVTPNQYRQEHKKV